MTEPKPFNSFTYVYIENCGPCKSVSPIIDELIEEGYKINKIQFKEAVDKYNTQFATPCLLLDNPNDENKPSYIYNRDLIVGGLAVLRFMPDLFRATSLKDFIVTIINRHIEKNLTNDK